jgi:hypothetical protein
MIKVEMILHESHMNIKNLYRALFSWMGLMVHLRLRFR